MAVSKETIAKGKAQLCPKSPMLMCKYHDLFYRFLHPEHGSLAMLWIGGVFEGDQELTQTQRKKIHQMNLVNIKAFLETFESEYKGGLDLVENSPLRHFFTCCPVQRLNHGWRRVLQVHSAEVRRLMQELLNQVETEI